MNATDFIRNEIVIVSTRRRDDVEVTLKLRHTVTVTYNMACMEELDNSS